MVRKWMRAVWFGVAALAAALAIQGYRVAQSSGLFAAIEPRPLACRAIEGVVGAEDITVNRATGYAYISSDNRRATQGGRPVSGAIYGIDLAQDAPEPVLLWRGPDDYFHPHGLGLFVPDEGEAALMAINHPLNDSHRIEVFAIPEQETLVHVRTVTDRALVSPNDIAVVGPRQFYVTNDHGYPAGWRQAAEDYLGLPLATVAYFDGDGSSVVATGFRYANGITMSQDGGEILVAETTGRRVTILDRDPARGALVRRKSIDVDTGVDNLEWAPTGELLVAGHPRLFDFLAHAGNPTARSPSQVKAVSVAGEPEVVELYVSDGSEISGASVAAAFGARMLIGSVFENRVLLCDLR